MVAAIIKNIFNKKSAATAQPEAPQNPYEKLRSMALGMSTVEQIQPTDAGLYALLCEYEVSGGTVTEVYSGISA